MDSPTSGRRPNLLYIHSDQHNPFVTGCYGDPVVETPNLDGLARRGVTFTNAYCPSPVCVPSRMAMLTGKYPHEIDVWTNHHILGSDHPTLAHAMGAAGYRPVLMGRMHSVGIDQLHGYAERPIGDHGSNHPGGGEVPREARGSLESSGAGQSGYQVHDEDVTAATVDFLNRHGIRRRAGVTGEPFCLSVGFMLPHAPYVARRADFDRYRDRVTLPRVRTPFDDRLHPFEAWWRSWSSVEEVPDHLILRARAAYWALIDRMDALIGDIMEALRRNGLEDDTLIVYHSDHGDMAGEHDLWMKRCHYEASARIPAIVSWPGVLPEGVACDRVVSALDLNATMLDALGADPLPGSHGRSLLDLLGGRQTAWDDLAYCEYCVYEGWTTRMIRRGGLEVHLLPRTPAAALQSSRGSGRAGRPERRPGVRGDRQGADGCRARRLGPGRRRPEDARAAPCHRSDRRLVTGDRRPGTVRLAPHPRHGLRGAGLSGRRYFCLRMYSSHVSLVDSSCSIRTRREWSSANTGAREK